MDRAGSTGAWEWAGSGQALPETGGPFRVAFMGAAIGLCVTALDGTFLDANPAMCRMLGRSAQDLQARSHDSLVHPEDASASGDCVRRLLGGEASPLTAELRYLRPDGGVVRADVSAALCRGGDGEPLCLVRQAQGQSGRRPVEGAVEGLELPQELLRDIRDIAMVLSRDLVVLSASPGLGIDVGLPLPELIGTPALAHLPPELFESRAARLAEVLETRQAVQFEDHYAGHTHVNSIYPVLDPDGEVSRLTVISREVTEQRDAERQARERSQILDSILAASPMGITLMRGRVPVWTNGAMAAMCGQTVEEHLRLAPRVLYAEEEEFQRVGRVLYEDRDPGEIRETDTSWVRGDGSRVRVHLAARAVETEDGRQEFIITASDITERLRQQGELLASLERYRGLYDAVPSGVVVCGRDGVVSDVNDAACSILGAPRDVLVGWNAADSPLDAVHEDGSGFAEAEWPLTLALQSGERSRNVVMGLRRPGYDGLLWLLMNAEPRLDTRTGQVEAAVLTLTDISDRRRAEDALRQSEGRFRSAFDHAPIGIALVSLEGRYIRVNRAMCSMLGRSPEELVGADLALVTHPDDVVLSRRWTEHLVRAGDDTARYSKRFVHAGGRVVFAELSCCLVRDEEGRPLHVLAHVEDVTDRRRTEVALRDSERRFRGMADLLPDMVFELDPKLRVTYISRAVGEALGYSQADLRDDSDLSDVVDAGTLERLQCAFEAAAQGQPVFGVYDVTRRDGKPVPVEMHAVRVLGTDGQLLGFRGVMRDITERRRAQAALRESERRFREMADLLPDMIFELDMGLRVTYINAAVGGVLGYTQDDLEAGLSLADVTDAETYVRAQEGLAETVARGPLIGEFGLRGKDGRVVPAEVHAMGRVNPDGGLIGYSGVARDITDRRRVEHAQRLASVGQLALGVAHEFNNLLASLMLQAEMTEDDQTPEQSEALVKTALLVAGRGRDVCRNLATFARPSVPRREPMQIEAAIDEAVDLAAQEIRSSDVVVRRDYAAAGSRVIADRGQLVQVFLNLLVNACHAMRQGGRLAIRTTRVTGLGDDRVVVTVADTGPGIKAADLPRIFEPFFTTKGRLGDSEIAGSGLGLSVSHGIIKAHGGEISARSEPGQGTTFEVALPAWLGEGGTPAVEGTSPAREPVNPPGQAARTGRVLVAEDAPDLSAFVSAVIRGHGHEVDCVHTTPEALSAMQASHYDLVVTDLLMPGGGGWEVLKLAATMDGAPRVLVLSGLVGAQVEEDAMAMGASGFLRKPVSRADLSTKVGELLA